MNRKNSKKTNLKELPIIRGRFKGSRVGEYLSKVFSEEEITEMEKQGVDQRMVFGINPHYHSLATGGGLKSDSGEELVPDMPPSTSILGLIMPRLGETFDMEGQEDPSNQMKYTPSALQGKILHKYDEIVLAYAAFACSAHCRYCYRLDLFNRTTGKSWVRPEELRDYIASYNKKIQQTGEFSDNTGTRRYPIREVLLSGGDPMVMSNGKLFKFLDASAQSGVRVIRIGTKEIAFRPERFDENLLSMLRMFHADHPDVHINFVVHFSHPDEFLLRDSNNEYVDGKHGYRWLNTTEQAVRGLQQLGFVSLENQTPMIDRVNDSEQAMRILHEELRRKGIKPKYVFQCREIEGHRAFSVPLEKAWHIHNESQKGLSDTTRSRFVMSAEHGKTEIIGISESLPQEALSKLPKSVQSAAEAIAKEGLITFKVHRSPSDTNVQGELIIAKRNEEALWLSGYEDRILYDGRKEGIEQFTGLLNALCSGLDESKTKPTWEEGVYGRTAPIFREHDLPMAS